MEHVRADLIAREAELVLKRVRHTDFEREPTIDPKTGTYRVDDAAFVALVLERCAPDNFARIPKHGHERYPCATEFYEFLASPAHQGWEHVGKLADAQRGDIIVWGNPKGAHHQIADTLQWSRVRRSLMRKRACAQCTSTIRVQLLISMTRASEGQDTTQE
jgi:hypothetical protein